MSTNRRKRVSLNISFQPYEGEPIKQVVDYLFALSKNERHKQVANILVPAFLPYAFYHNGNYSFEQLRYLCWRSQESLNNHGYYMRLALGIPETDSSSQNQITSQTSQSFQTHASNNILYQNKSSIPLILRFQPYEGDSMADIVKYLLSKSKDEINKQVTDILVPALLPYALYKIGNYTREQLSYLCWRSQEFLNNHGYYMRLALGIPEPDSLSKTRETQAISVTQPTDNHVADIDINDISTQENKASLKDLNSVFGL